MKINEYTHISRCLMSHALLKSFNHDQLHIIIVNVIISLQSLCSFNPKMLGAFYRQQYYIFAKFVLQFNPKMLGAFYRQQYYIFAKFVLGVLLI